MGPTPETTTSCAACARPLRGERYLEPVGPGDAIVALCAPCALEEVVPKADLSAHTFHDPEEPATGRAAAIALHRNGLAARGICRNGEKHGAVMPGKKICAACWARQKSRTGRPKKAA